MSISARDRRMYALAQKIAEASECVDKHGAVLAFGSRVIRVATNSNAGGRGLAETQHAEHRTLYWTDKWPIVNADGATVYSARAHAFPISKPCDTCQEELLRCGVTRVIYSDGWSLQELNKES